MTATFATDVSLSAATKTSIPLAENKTARRLERSGLVQCLVGAGIISALVKAKENRLRQKMIDHRSVLINPTNTPAVLKNVAASRICICADRRRFIGANPSRRCNCAGRMPLPEQESLERPSPRHARSLQHDGLS